MKAFRLEISEKDREIWHKFRVICMQNHDSMAARLRRFVREVVEEHQKKNKH